MSTLNPPIAHLLPFVENATSTPLPEWLTAFPTTCHDPDDYRDSRESPEQVALRLHYFEQNFEYFLENVAEGRSPRAVFENDPRFERNAKNMTAKFMYWVKKDKARWARYREAQAIGAEIDFDDLPAMAAGTLTDSSLPEDVQRSTLRVQTQWKRLAIINRERFGDVKQVEITQNISITKALEMARERVIEGRSERVDDGEDA